MSSYIYVLAPFALGIILAICSSAYCIYIHFSKRRLVKRVRAQMLARIIYGSETEVEDAQFHADKQRKLSFLPLSNWRNAHVHGKFGNKQSNNLRGQREKSHPKAEEQQKQTIRGNVDGLLGESSPYLNMPGAPGRSSSQFSGDSREQPNTQYLLDAKRNSHTTQLPSNKIDLAKHNVYMKTRGPVNTDNPTYRTINTTNMLHRTLEVHSHLSDKDDDLKWPNAA